MLYKGKEIQELLFMDVLSFAQPSDGPNHHIIPFRRDENGYLRGTAIIAAIGVQTYKLADGRKIRVLRHPDEVFTDSSLATMRMLPLVVRHPLKNFTPETLQGKQVGSTGEGVFNDAYYIYAPISVNTAKAQNVIDSGEMRELSVGYRAGLLMDGGEWQGQAFDAQQVNIRGNHLAIVKRARAGNAASFTMSDGSDYEVNYADCDAMLQDDINTELIFNDDNSNNKPTNKPTEAVLMKYTLKNGQVVEADQAFIDSHSALLTENETLTAAALANEAKHKTELSAKDTEIKDGKENALSVDDVLKAANILNDVRATAKIAEVEIKDDATAQAIKVAIIKKVMPESEFKDDDEIQVNAFFDAAKKLLVASPDKSKENREKMGGKVVEVHDSKDKGEKKVLTAADIDNEYHDSLQNAHLTTSKS